MPDQLAACYVWHEVCWKKAVRAHPFFHKKNGVPHHQEDNNTTHGILPLRISGRRRRGHLNVQTLHKAQPHSTNPKHARQNRTRKRKEPREVMPSPIDVVLPTASPLPCKVRVGGTRGLLALLSKHNRWAKRLRGPSGLDGNFVQQ